MKPVSALLATGLACLGASTFLAVTQEITVALYIVTTGVALAGSFVAMHQLHHSIIERALMISAGTFALLLTSIGGGKVVAYLLANAGWLNTSAIQTDQLFYQAFLVGPVLGLPGVLLLAATIRAIRSAPKH